MWYNEFQYYAIVDGERVVYNYEIELGEEPEIYPYYTFSEIKEIVGDDWERAESTTWEYNADDMQIKVYVGEHESTPLYVWGYDMVDGIGECGYDEPM